MANCNKQQLNITCGTDVVLYDRLVFDGETFDPNLSVGITANLVSSLGKRTALDVEVVDDALLISVPWIDGTLPGCYGLEVTGSCNSKKWSTYADSLIKYTKATVPGASEVTVESDSYDITMEVAYCYSDAPLSSVEATVDDNYGTPSVDVVYKQRRLSMAFHNLKGEPFTYDDFTEEQLEDLRGPQGEKGEESDKGLRQIILKEDIPFPTQLSETDTIYVIRYDYDLEDSEVTIPSDCTLKFEGGTLSNGTIIGQDTRITNDLGCILNDIIVSGTFKNDCVYSNWISNDTDTTTLQAAMNLCNGEYPTKLFIAYGNYDIDGVGGDADASDGGLFVPCNTDVDFQNATLKVIPNNNGRYYLIRVLEDNVSLKNGSFIGDVGTHTGSSGEWGHGVVVKGAKNVILDNIYCTLFWGDGFNISYVTINPEAGADTDVILSENVLMRNCTSYDNRRQGLSVISVKGLRIYDSKFIKTGNTAMTAPGAGIDFEQDWHNKSLITDVIVDGCELSGSKGIVINDKLSMSAVRTYNVTIKDCLITGASQIRVKQGANLYFSNCVFNTWIQYSDGDVTLDNCTFKSQWFLTSVDNQLERNCTININFCNFNIALVYETPIIFRTSSIVGVKSLNLIGCNFDVNYSGNDNKIYSLVTEDNASLENLILKIHNCNFQCSSQGSSFSEFGWNIWTSGDIVGCTINRCKKLTLYRRITDPVNNVSGYTLKVKENIIRFKKQQASDYTPYIYCAGNLTHSSENKRDFIITDNIFFFDVMEAPLWADPGTTGMSLTFCRNEGVGKVISGNGVRESYFTYVVDERASGESNFVVQSSVNYNGGGAPWQRAIDTSKKMVAFNDGTNWRNCMGQKIGKQYGNTASRPDFLDVSDTGYQYFDTDLGYLIVWNGANWVDATGTTV